ncbi:YciI family protein [Brevibacterium casei]|uniref:YCII-related domain-containing protein n=1 Tax=Brevibacterium casei TaxID=33889 RepID=A0A7T3ZXZ9_9MICO|nr:YciI family protein [Brevibacterium casei]QQB13677.1 hypothetical protein I6H47_12835 [Brevibacterium casei]
MPVFAVTYVYGPDTETRLAHRPAHRQWQAAQNASGAMLASGPFTDDEQPGGLLLVSAADRDAALDMLTGDPYHDLGVIAETRIREWNPMFGAFAED